MILLPRERREPLHEVSYLYLNLKRKKKKKHLNKNMRNIFDFK